RTPTPQTVPSIMRTLLLPQVGGSPTTSSTGPTHTPSAPPSENINSIVRAAPLKVRTPTTVDLFLIRHGETPLNDENRMRGWLDTPVDEEGLKELDKTANFLRGTPLKRLLSSDL